jgi:hypothetical protein
MLVITESSNASREADESENLNKYANVCRPKVRTEAAIIDVDEDDINNNEFNKSYGVHACCVTNSCEGVDDASQRPEEQNYGGDRNITSQQLREMLNEEEDLTPSQMVYLGCYPSAESTSLHGRESAKICSTNFKRTARCLLITYHVRSRSLYDHLFAKKYSNC